MQAENLLMLDATEISRFIEVQDVYECFNIQDSK